MKTVRIASRMRDRTSPAISEIASGKGLQVRSQAGAEGGSRTPTTPSNDKDLQQTIALNREDQGNTHPSSLAQLANTLSSLAPEDKALLAALLLGNQGGAK